MNNNIRANIIAFGLSNVFIDSIMTSLVVNNAMPLSDGISNSVVCLGTTFSIATVACINEMINDKPKLKKK